MTKTPNAVKKPKRIRINFAYEDAEAIAFERLKRATGIANNVDLVRFTIRQAMTTYNVRNAGE